jgi:hypothetical protein
LGLKLSQVSNIKYQVPDEIKKLVKKGKNLEKKVSLTRQIK